MIVEIRNKTDAALLLKISVDRRPLESIGLADGEVIPLELPNSGGSTIELVKVTKNRHCG